MEGADPIAQALQRYVDAGELAGAATLVWRGGAVVQQASVGWRDTEARLPMTRDTLFRIASLTKPVTSVAALMLVDDGRIALDEPIARHAPEFARMRVLRHAEGPLDETDAAEQPITFKDLLTHRAGFTYSGFHTGPIGRAYDEALGPDIDSFVGPEEQIGALARLPLIDQPGANFHYGRSTDLLGMLIARIEGASLGEVLARRIFRPLGMKDTSFRVPPQDHARRSAMHGFDVEGRLTRLAVVPGGAALPERPADMAYESGSGGLWSTIDDYLAFARLFVEGGQVDGVRFLQPRTLAGMMTNQLTPEQRRDSEMLGMPAFATGHGFGLGVAVVMEPETAQVVRCGGGVGAVGWPGAYGTWWQADPNDGSVMVFMAQNGLELSQLARGVGLGVYMAITEFQALASRA